MSDSVAMSTMDLFSSGAIKLNQLSVYNWGSFDGLHTARIDPEGTLITGDNGAGKSTLIDALMALLLPAGKATFNVAAAQGDRTDRSLISYIRGSFGAAHEGSRTRVMSKREGAVVTALRAFYLAEDGSKITLAAVFWMTHAGNALADLKRIYLVARRDLALTELLDAFADGDPRSLKQFLRQDSFISSSDDRFSEYQESYRRLLHMDNPNAPALLARALGLKKIDDLTTLIRDLVLEPSNVREDARKAVSEFADLVTIHDQLLDARHQRDALIDLPEVEKTLNQAEQELNTLDAQLKALSAWFGEQCAELWAQRLISINQALKDAEQRLQLLRQQLEDAAGRVEQCHADYLQAGGERIESVKKDLKIALEKLNAVIVKASEYQKLTGLLQLDDGLTAALFQLNQDKAVQARNNLQQEKRRAQDDFAHQAAELSNVQTQQQTLQQEITEISARPDSNIDIKFQNLRDEMVQALDLQREQVMFIGELIDVKEQERVWQGAIERALGGLRTTLAVPQSDYHLVTRWLNQRHTGLHVRVQVVRQNNQHSEFMVDGYLRKLVWREHAYRDWLKQHLKRFDLHCVKSTEILNKTPFSMTQQGMIQMDKGRFEKKDLQRIDDRRAWQMGFSNKNRLQLLRQDNEQLKQQLAELERTVKDARAQWDGVEKRDRLWEKLGEYKWSEIDAPYWQQKVKEYQADIDALEQAGGDLAKARRRWEESKQRWSQLQDEQNQHNQQFGVIKTNRDSAEQQRQQALKLAEQGISDSLRAELLQRVGVLKDAQLNGVSKIENQHRQKIEQQRSIVANRKDRASRSAVGIMSAYRSRWEVIAADWGADLASLGEYLQQLQQLQQEGLPALVEKFRERLNRHTTQSLARIRSRIDSEREDIAERIETINSVLQRTEFRVGSYLRLGIKSDLYEHVVYFNKLLTEVMGQLNSDDHEARFATLQEVVEILQRASQAQTANNLESLRLLDPRHQLSFFAEEIDMQTTEVRDVLMSSSGKSGGEKESFAGTIVAASLAYVLTPDGGDRPVYSTVFLDEAFSNTAEAVSRRVLRVFRELHIHVNLITPYKNLNLARESARSLLIAERDSEAHESRLCEVSWEEIDRRLAQTAQSYGIKLEQQT